MPQEPVITDEMRDAVGVDSEPATHEVEKGAISRFAEAIGDPNPLYRDEQAARGSRYSAMVAPPTFLRSMEAGPPKVELRTPYTALLDGGSEWEYFEPVRPRDTITVTSRIVDLTERTGRLGPTLFVVYETTYVNQSGEAVAVQRNTLIHYQPASGSAG